MNQLYVAWLTRIWQLRPGERITRVRNLAWLITGTFDSRSVHLSRVATKIPSKVNLLSVVRRLTRLLANPTIRVREWYEPITRDWLDYVARTTGEIRLIADGTKIGFGHQLLIISLAYRRRAIPLVWTWIKCAKGHSSAYRQLALLGYMYRLIPGHIPVRLVGDSEFGAVEVIRQLEAWRWGYVLRQKANNQMQVPGQAWQDLGAVIAKPCQSIRLGPCLLTVKHVYPTNLLAHWQVGEKEPWLLATNLPERNLTLRTHSRRMWTEEMFGNLKSNGFDLETTHLQHVARLSRLTLAVVLLYTWLMVVGTKVIKNGCAIGLIGWSAVICVFQVGLRTIERRMTNALSFAFYFEMSQIEKLSGD